MIRILIIGSKGFIGSHSYEYFQNKDAIECWACDVVVDYVDKNYFLIDTSNSDFNQIFEEKVFDVCINCSGAASVPDSLKYPYRDFSLNTHNVIKILDAIRRHAPHCKFINLSSAAVYGNPYCLPVKEHASLKPVSPYGIHKMQAEQICQSYHNFWQIKTCSLRIFSAYGPGLKKQLFWDLYQKAISTTEINLFGTGLETRDFIFVDDIIQAIEVVLANAQFKGECINVANGKEVAIKEVVDRFYKALGWKGKINFMGDARVGDPVKWQADISFLNSLGYQQKYSLEAGITKYVKWLRELG